MKKFLSIILLAALLVCSFSFVGCGDKTYEIALVTDVGNIDDKSFNQGAWEGVKKFAEDNNKTYSYYRPTEDSTTARVETITTAINAGAKVIVCPGYLFEEAVYEVQTKFPDVIFLLLDGEPHTPDYAVYKTEDNVHCILYKEEQAGFFAGYAAVKDGYTKLGFLGGMDVPAVIRYGYGFVQGANKAAEELGNADKISVNYWYCGSFVPSDEIVAKMNNWYSSGTEIVFSCGGGIYLSAINAATANNGKVIGVDVDQYAESDLIITSAMKGLTNSVVLALTDLYKNVQTVKDENGKDVEKLAWPAEYAGKTANLGVAENCVGLPTAKDSWRFAKFTVEEYNAIFDKVNKGEIKIDNQSDKATHPEVAIAVDYQG